ncbi:MAG: hypothetical protein HC887_09605 [Desulfobacteraceae bacterium]|nr:hypothetical protein [Desulfobacteraceae bacterium]
MRSMITRMELMIEMAETEIYPGFTQNLSLTDNRAILQSGTMKMQEPFAVDSADSLSPKMPWTGCLRRIFGKQNRDSNLCVVI